ncbi:MAG: hypothetical protein IME92_04935 [Proteobacteria bacterium]|nr:hypothetical protein [Pseudomonadota bacterium]
MLNRQTKFIVGLIATTLMTVFIIGLAYSISTGFAGFWGGLPFWIISLTVLSMAIYNFWEECIKKKD